MPAGNKVTFGTPGSVANDAINVEDVPVNPISINVSAFVDGDVNATLRPVMSDVAKGSK
jgi:hypothetical protein